MVCRCAAVPCCAVLRSCDPLQLVPLPFGGDPNNALPLWFVLVNPKFEAPTKEMRAVLPQQVGGLLTVTISGTEKPVTELFQNGTASGIAGLERRAGGRVWQNTRGAVH